MACSRAMFKLRLATSVEDAEDILVTMSIAVVTCSLATVAMEKADEFAMLALVTTT